jgi:plasmid stability protein
MIMITQRTQEVSIVKIFSVRIPDELKILIDVRAKGQHRQPADQVRRYLEIAIIAEENPDLPFLFIEGILEAQAELDAGLAEPYEFGDGVSR